MQARPWSGTFLANRQGFPIFNSPQTGNPGPGVSDPEGPQQPGGPTLPNSYLPPPPAPPIYFPPAEMNRQWQGMQARAGPRTILANRQGFPIFNRPQTGNPRPGVSDPEGPQQPTQRLPNSYLPPPPASPIYFPPSEMNIQLQQTGNTKGHGPTPFYFPPSKK